MRWNFGFFYVYTHPPLFANKWGILKREMWHFLVVPLLTLDMSCAKVHSMWSKMKFLRVWRTPANNNATTPTARKATFCVKKTIYRTKPLNKELNHFLTSRRQHEGNSTPIIVFFSSHWEIKRQAKKRRKFLHILSKLQFTHHTGFILLPISFWAKCCFNIVQVDTWWNGWWQKL